MQSLISNRKRYLSNAVSQHGSMSPDPAPSLISYRLQRLWLTPVFRVVIRIGLPVFFIFLFAFMFLSKAENWDYVRGIVNDAQVSIQSQPEYRLDALSIEGASPLLQQDIQTKFGSLFPISAFELNLDEMRKWIESIPSVDSAVVMVSAAGLLSVKVLEIPAAFVWRNEEGLKLVSHNGKILRNIMYRIDFSHLPLIAGKGAVAALAEAQSILVYANPILDRLRGLVRVGQRRWNLILLDGQTIALPENGPELALSQAIVLGQAQNLFKRDISVIDFRNPGRPTLRIRPIALKNLKKSKIATLLEDQNE
ncbi:MAG: cell division protein FtsQ/DivIB [Planktomarina sp.]|nr:cell division protein FtsQ/DivIB [Planktomarina sp.]